MCAAVRAKSVDNWRSSYKRFCKGGREDVFIGTPHESQQGRIYFGGDLLLSLAARTSYLASRGVLS